MKLRVLPIALTAIITASVLFGGWFLYRHMAIQNPLQQVVTKYPGVSSAQINIKQDEVILKLVLKPDADLRGLVQQVKKEGQSIIGSRQLKLDIQDRSSAELDAWWSQAMFPIAEAMENKKYTQIPATLETLEQKNAKVQAQTEMDDQNVYIRLKEGQASKFIILPREPETMGVWPNA
ncbi:hypothetical protein OIN60_07485 [Paenibacillus sp. P96]|uniref:Uncharacterized protein n=1 Tax=Paenibacillus zeirhizosphaerae TaxID=2987519 RepID=A0ABT9FPK8_9BACL|nr:hypothetical protein [Paenibacillus sp. P96]MDP4096609.1 hypothetical protein [Paenibacillus sp. P96]